MTQKLVNSRKKKFPQKKLGHPARVNRFRMPGNMDSTGLAVGLKKGFIVEKRKLAPRPASRKGVRETAPHSRF
jgi:hypothetical protein